MEGIAVNTYLIDIFRTVPDIPSAFVTVAGR